MSSLETVISVNYTGVKERQDASNEGNHLEYEEECKVIDRD